MNSEFKRMMQLAGLTEIAINAPTPLNRIQGLKAKIDASNDKKERFKLAIECIKIALPIFKKLFPKNNRVERAIAAAEDHLANPSSDTRRFADVASGNAYQASWEASESNLEGAGAAAYIASAAANLADSVSINLDDVDAIVNDIIKAIELSNEK